MARPIAKLCETQRGVLIKQTSGAPTSTLRRPNLPQYSATIFCLTVVARVLLFRAASREIPALPTLAAFHFKRNHSSDVLPEAATSASEWVMAEGAMWWKRRKVERLFDELRAIALRNRLDTSRTDLSQNHPDASGRETRQLELLAEIAELDSRYNFVGRTTPQRETPVPTSSGRPRAA
jgi:hypothetical protein